ncbi:type VI secretion system lysozyme-like protein [Caenispirillum bisanense]|uniref:Type VI secretion system lysozyme-like protein n=1 Tax=Caenispirillum bisanense TaxID=414052 RepID=A0A286GXZ1_9PROT|nr:type VI secretion system lysozyme-like protein [Caenispirillum bisanense]
MPQPKSLVGLRAPLFERLIDLRPGSGEDAQDLSFQTHEAVAASIRREVARILDTRLPWLPEDDDDEAPPADDEAEEGMQPVDMRTTVVRYGLPDLSHLCVSNNSERHQIERLILEAVRTFEPRLEEPTVAVHLLPSGDGAHVEIGGMVRLGRSLEPLVFSLASDLRVGGKLKRRLVKAAAERQRRVEED